MFSNNFVSSSQTPTPKTITVLPSATVIFGQAWSLYKQRLGTFLGIMIIPMLVSVGLLLVLMNLKAVFTDGEFPNLIMPEYTFGDILPLIILGILFFLVNFIIQTWGQIALLYAIKDSKEGIGVGKAYRRGWHKILSYW